MASFGKPLVAYGSFCPEGNAGGTVFLSAKLAPLMGCPSLHGWDFDWIVEGRAIRVVNSDLKAGLSTATIGVHNHGLGREQMMAVAEHF